VEKSKETKYVRYDSERIRKILEKRVVEFKLHCHLAD
jgi:hypothetical protein